MSIETRNGKVYTRKKEILEDILGYFQENENEFIEAIEELDSYNDYLNDDRQYPMEELSEFLCGIDPLEAIERAFFGYDKESYNGERYEQSFNPYRKYFYFNGYGNLVSTDYLDYSSYLDEYFVEELADHWNKLGYCNEYVEELLVVYQNVEKTGKRLFHTYEDFEEIEEE